MHQHSASARPQIVLIAGPYRSGTGNDPVKMNANLRALERYALPLFRAGHLPVIGEWVALPIIAVAGSETGDAPYDEFLYPVAERLLQRCDAVLRVEGASAGADADVRRARELGLPVYHRLEDLGATDE